MLFQNLLKPKWQHSNADVRKQALGKLEPDDPEQLSILRDAAKSDPDADVRRTAIKRINDLECVWQAANDDSDAGVRDVARHRFMQLLCGNDPFAPSVETRQDWLNKTNDSRVLEHVAQNGDTTTLRLSALDLISTGSVFEKIVINDADIQVRLNAVDKISDVSTLNRIVKLVRGKDKRITRALKDRIQTCKAEQDVPQEAENQAKAICLNLQTAVENGYSNRLANQLSSARDKWSALPTLLDHSLTQRFQTLCQRAESLLEQYESQEQARLAQQQEFDQLRQSKQKLIDALRHCMDALRNNDPSIEISEIELLLKNTESQWDALDKLPNVEERKLESELASSRAEIAEWLAALKRQPKLEEHASELLNAMQAQLANANVDPRAARSLLNRAQKLHWPQILGEAPAAFADLTALSDKIEQSLSAQNQALEQAKSELPKICDRLEQHIEQGELNKANQSYRKAKQMLDKAGRVPGDVQRRLNSLHARLRDLSDWKGFAVAPKKEALCEEMEKLASAAIPPDELAKQIKTLQEDWKSLGGDGSTAANELWQRFKTAGDLAFEPCRAYFENLSKEREENLATRVAVCEKLEAFLSETNWDSADWRAVDQFDRDIRQTWRDCGPTDRKPGKGVSDRFHNGMDALRGKLKAEHQRNKAAKQAIIDEAKALVEKEDAWQAANDIKRLQTQWKQIGVVHPRDVQPLWKVFREACDAVFAKRQTVIDEREQERSGHLQQRNDIADQIQALTQLDAAAFKQSAETFKELKAAWLDAGELAKDDIELAQKYFDAACKAYYEHDEALLKAAKQAKVDAVNKAKELCEKAEDALFNETLGDFAEQIEADWAAIGPIDSRYSSILKQRFQRIREWLNNPPSHHDLALAATENRGHAKVMCIRLEILGEIDSPPEYQDERRAYQVSRLAEEMTSRSEDIESQYKDLVTEWYGLSPFSPADRKTLEERFARAKKAVEDLMSRR